MSSKDMPDEPTTSQESSEVLRQRKSVSPKKEEEEENEQPTVEETPKRKIQIPEELSSVAEVKKLVTKEPQKIPTVYEKLVGGIVKDNNFLIFTVTWLPLMMMTLGNFLGSIILMVTHSWHFLAGIGIGLYVFQIFKAKNKDDNERVKEILRVSAIAPIIMCHNYLENFFSNITILLAFSTTPFGLDFFFPTKESKIDKLKQELLKINIAPAVTFVISTGGSGNFHTLYLCAVFAAAYFIVENVYPSLIKVVEPKLPPQLKENNNVLIFVGLEYVIAHALQWILHYLLFSSYFVNQNGFFLSLFYSVLGLGVLVSGRLLLEMKENENIKKAKQVTLGTIGVSYGGLLIGYMIKHLWS